MKMIFKCGHNEYHLGCNMNNNSNDGSRHTKQMVKMAISPTVAERKHAFLFIKKKAIKITLSITGLKEW